MSSRLMLVSLLVACGGKGSEPPYPWATTTETTTATGTTATSTTTSTSTTTTTTTGQSSGAFTVTGSYNGYALDYACQLDGTDADWTSDLQCQSVQFFVYCRPDPWDQVPDVDTMQLWFYLGTHLEAGTHDFDAATGGGISWGDGMALPLAGWSTNLVSNQIVVDAIDPQVSASGSYSASWSDDGGNYGEVSGTFDLVCD